MKENNFPLVIENNLLALAQQHGLFLEPSSFVYNETGLDFQVVQARDLEEQSWILRIPRRSDVLPRAHNEHLVLQLIKEKLPVAVPHWEIFEPSLIAYRQLPGHPAATIDMEQKQYNWNLDPAELPVSFFSSLASALVALHAIGLALAAEAGLKISTPAKVRETLNSQMNQVKTEIGVADALWQQWQVWLKADKYWPTYSGLVHGDLQAAHLLIDHAGALTGLLDWTEAEVSDPAIDFVIFLATFGEKALHQLLEQYRLAGGKTWPTMFEHIQQRQAAYGVNIGLFVLASGQEAYLPMAKAALGLSEA